MEVVKRKLFPARSAEQRNRNGNERKADVTFPNSSHRAFSPYRLIRADYNLNCSINLQLNLAGPVPSGDRNDAADERPDGEREECERKTAGPASDQSDEVRAEKSAKIPDGIDQSDSCGGARAAQEFRRHRPEWAESSPDADRRQ